MLDQMKRAHRGVIFECDEWGRVKELNKRMIRVIVRLPYVENKKMLDYIPEAIEKLQREIK